MVYLPASSSADVHGRVAESMARAKTCLKVVSKSG